MFKNPFQVAISFAIIALIVKLVIFYLGVQHHEISYVTLIYMLLTLTAVFFGIRSEKINNEGNPTSFGQDFRAGARTASFFAMLVAGITFFYYAQIDSDFFSIMKENKIEEFKKIAPEQIRKNGIEKTREYVKASVSSFELIYTPFASASYTLFGLVVLGVINSVIFSLLMKKFPGFKQ